MLMASSADRVERQAVQQRRSLIPSDEVENDARALSDLARLYVVKPLAGDAYAVSATSADRQKPLSSGWPD